MTRFLFSAMIVLLVTVSSSTADIVTSAPISGLRYTISVFGTPQPIEFSFVQDSGNLVSGSLDTDTRAIDYSVLPHGGLSILESRTINREILVSAAIPATPPVCDLNSCTPGTPFVPAVYQIVPTSFQFEFSVNSFPVVLGSNSTTVVPGSIGPNSASIPSTIAAHFPATLDGTWKISGPTQMQTGSLSLVPTSSFSLSTSLQLERTPPSLGPVTVWAQSLNGDRFTQTISGVSVDGVDFQIDAVASVVAVPEPSGMMLLGLIAACSFAVRTVRRCWFIRGEK